MLPIAILAGGLARRLRPITDVIPKSLIKICGQPFVHWQVKQLASSGFTEIVYCVANKSEMIEDFLGDGKRYGVSITYSHDGPKLLGTGGAIIKALPQLGKKFMLLYGDSYLPIDFREVENKFAECDKPALMTVYANYGTLDASNVAFRDGILLRYEKGIKSTELTHIDYGLSCFDESIFLDYATELPVDLAQICSSLASQKKLAGYEVTKRFYEIGSHQGIVDFTTYVERYLSEL